MIFGSGSQIAITRALYHSLSEDLAPTPLSVECSTYLLWLLATTAIDAGGGGCPYVFRQAPIDDFCLPLGRLSTGESSWV